MSISEDTIERGVAACFPQPVSQESTQEAQSLVEAVHYINCVHATSPLVSEIVYRGSLANYDLRNHVFRWDTRDHRDIFVNGFRAWPQGDTPDSSYYNLFDHVIHGRAIANPSQVATPRVFVSTTLSTAIPGLTNPVGTVVYRYEIYAPGGIMAWQTLSPLLHRTDLTQHDRDLIRRFRNQQEVSFLGGIARQYIRAAIPYRITSYDNRGHARVERFGTTMAENRYFNPQSHPPRRINILRPCIQYRNEYNRARNLEVVVYPHQAEARRKKREVAPSEDPASAIIEWYARGVADYESYVDAAFRSSRTNEAYLFMKNEYVLLNYAPHSTGDRVLNGPLLICDGFPSLAGTTFGEYGIDCAFGTHYSGESAFIFAGNLCAVVNYASHTTEDKITKGPTTISNMFPFFKGTAFETGIDAAFEATSTYEAYLFKGNEYALINYHTPKCIAIRPIIQGFASLKNTIFEGGIDAAFASHEKNEAYLFKRSQYALINFAPGSTKDYIIDGTVKDIIPNWPSLARVLPRKNEGLDMHPHG